MSIELVALGISTVFGIIGWLLKNKDRQQEKELDEHSSRIALLFEKYDKSVADLQDFRVQIAGNHYQKHEMDARFDKLETAFRDGIRPLSEKVDKLAEYIMENMRR